MSVSFVLEIKSLGSTVRLSVRHFNLILSFSFSFGVAKAVHRKKGIKKPRSHKKPQAPSHTAPAPEGDRERQQSERCALNRDRGLPSYQAVTRSALGRNYTIAETVFCVSLCRDSDYSLSAEEEEAMSDVFSSDDEEQEDSKDYHKGLKNI